MPKPLSRIQLLCTRLLAPPAPAKMSPLKKTEIGTASDTPIGTWPKFANPWKSFATASAVMAEKMAMTRNTNVRPTLKNSAFSMVL